MIKNTFYFCHKKNLLFRKRKILLLILLISFLSNKPGAVENANVPFEKLVPGNVRLTNESSAGAEFASVEKNVMSFIKRWEIAGASIAIAKDGKLIFCRGFGYADTASKSIIQPFSKFRIASISKLVTATAIMKLQEEGKLLLTDKVFGEGAILDDPYFSNPKDKRVGDITVEQLLSHEAGWTQRYGDQMFMPLVVAKNMEVDLRLIQKPLFVSLLINDFIINPAPGKHILIWVTVY